MAYITQDNIKTLQRLLNLQGADLEVDGKIGVLTKAAIKAFEDGLDSEDEEAQSGTDTEADDAEAPDEQDADAEPSQDNVYEYTEDIQYGNKGELTRQAQERFKLWGFDIAVDGIFGTETKAKVVGFQRAMNINKGTGVIDETTWNALMGEPVDTSCFPEDYATCNCSYSACAKQNHLPKSGRIPQAAKILFANFNKQLKSWYGDGAELLLTRQVYSGKNPVYRCAKQNSKAGGASNSAHLRANAFDYMVKIDGVVQKSTTFYKNLQKQFYNFNPYGGRSLNYNGNGHADIESPRTW